MSISSLRLMAAAAAVTGGLAVAAGPVAAQTCYPPTPGCGTTSSTGVAPPGPRLVLSDTTVFRGQTIRASVSGFRPGTTGIITIASVEQQIGAFAAGPAGTASTSVTIPTNITLGAHTVFARGTALNGAPGVASQAVTVFEADDDRKGDGKGRGTLARTGVFVIPTALIGAGLVAGGVALKHSTRRGKPTSTS